MSTPISTELANTLRLYLSLYHRGGGGSDSNGRREGKKDSNDSNEDSNELNVINDINDIKELNEENDIDNINDINELNNINDINELNNILNNNIDDKLDDLLSTIYMLLLNDLNNGISLFDILEVIEFYLNNTIDAEFKKGVEEVEERIESVIKKEGKEVRYDTIVELVREEGDSEFYLLLETLKDRFNVVSMYYNHCKNIIILILKCYNSKKYIYDIKYNEIQLMSVYNNMFNNVYKTSNLIYLIYMYLERTFVLYCVLEDNHDIVYNLNEFVNILNILKFIEIPFSFLVSKIINDFINISKNDGYESKLISFEEQYIITFDLLYDKSPLPLSKNNYDAFLSKLPPGSPFSIIVDFLSSTLFPFGSLINVDDNFENNILTLALDRYTYTSSLSLFTLLRDSNLPSDLAMCYAQLYPAAIQRAASILSQSVHTRLLQPGATTGDIITQYLSMRSALRDLDSSGVMLQIIATPVIAYLHLRRDTIRIVTSLFYSVLLHNHADNMKSDVMELAQASCAVESIKFFQSLPETSRSLLMDSSSRKENFGETVWEECITMKWQPEPKHKPTTLKPTPFTEKVDYLSELCYLLKPTSSDDQDIQSSFKTLLIDYRQMLAQRLILSTSYETDTEWALAELIKLRFGENLPGIIPCEVMLKDVSESRRTQVNIYTTAAAMTRKNTHLLLTAISRGNSVDREPSRPVVNISLSSISRNLSFGLESPISPKAFSPKALRFSLGSDATPIKRSLDDSMDFNMSLSKSYSRNQRIVVPRLEKLNTHKFDNSSLLVLSPSNSDSFFAENLLSSTIISHEFWPTLPGMEIPEDDEDDEDKCEEEMKYAGEWNDKHVPAMKKILDPKELLSSGFNSKCGIQDNELRNLKHVPNVIRYAMIDYAREYSKMKLERRLIWFPEVGVVTIELCLPAIQNLPELSIDFELTPVLASLLVSFGEKTEWTLTSLSYYLGYDPAMIRKRMQYWVGLGICTQHPIENNILYCVENMATMDSNKRKTIVDYAEKSRASHMDW